METLGWSEPNEEDTEFKSYYVVWKQYTRKKIKSGDWSCLNRTMQYGNQTQINIS